MIQELQLLNKKLDLLLKKYAALQTENAKLQQTIEDQKATIAQRNTRIEELEQILVAAQTAKSLTAEDKEVMRKQLDSVIGEIDKILKTLND